MLTISDLACEVEGKEILQSFSLTVNPGEIHAIMGPNGAGKSTLAKLLAGHPAYTVTSGTILFKGRDLLQLDPDERAHLGLFMSFQYPVEVPGVSNFQFLFAAYNAKRRAHSEKELTHDEFSKLLSEKMSAMEVRSEFRDRNLNEGFSGGEKKRNEILQMNVLDPDLAILDETDSGLDIDAMKRVASAVLAFMTPNKALILITHYQRLLDYIKPHFVHVMKGGRLVRSGGPELARILEQEGYESSKKEDS